MRTLPRIKTLISSAERRGKRKGSSLKLDMKTLYPKGKGKIHPSPSCANGSGNEALAALNLLPAAILALTAALCAEDKEVLAYLVTRSLQGPCGSRRHGHNQALFDCGCFDCYTSYWFRWDSSPDRELIHQAIEAFEEHLASSEQRRGGGKGGRRRDRRFDRAGKSNGRRKAGKEREDELPPLEEGSSHGSCSLLEERHDVEDEREVVIQNEIGVEAEVEEEGDNGGEAAAQSLLIGAEKRRPWMDVMGLFGSRFWNLWCPSP